MKAVIVKRSSDPKTVKTELIQTSIPTPGPKEVLIKNIYVASNPKDWKLHDESIILESRDLIEGNDVAGNVHSIGDGVTKFKVGDRVAGFSKIYTDDKYGAYAEYTVVPEHTTFHVKENVKFEDAATIGLAAMTAALGLFTESKLGLPTPENPNTGDRAVFINGASSSVGSFAVQLAKKAGLFVIGTAGSSNKIAKDAGVDVVIDYRGKSTGDLVNLIKDAAKGKTLEHSFDAISESESFSLCCSVLPPQATSKATFVLPTIPKDLDSKGVTITVTTVHTAHSEDAEFSERYYTFIADWMNEGSFKGNKVKIVPQGLNGVHSGLELLKNKLVNGEKLVYKISDTPSL